MTAESLLSKRPVLRLGFFLLKLFSSHFDCILNVNLRSLRHMLKFFDPKFFSKSVK